MDGSTNVIPFTEASQIGTGVGVGSVVMGVIVVITGIIILAFAAMGTIVGGVVVATGMPVFTGLPVNAGFNTKAIMRMMASPPTIYIISFLSIAEQYVIDFYQINIRSVIKIIPSKKLKSGIERSYGVDRGENDRILPLSNLIFQKKRNMSVFGFRKLAKI